jgi:hypothetical protein
MTKSNLSPASGLVPSRRLLLFGGLGVASTAALGLGHTGTAHAEKREDDPVLDFDLDTDNYLKFLGPTDDTAGESINQDVFGAMDITTFLWVNRITAIAAFDAVAPYHETAVGIYTKIKRRPSSESATNRNMNIAGLYAGWRVWQGVFGETRPAVRQFMTALGLDPDDQSEDTTSPVGIGNVVGKAAWNAHKRDGMNFLGDEGGRRYNPRPWADYTGYVPVNTPYELTHPSRWQPQLGPHNGRRVGGGPGDIGIYVAQHVVTPQTRRVRALTFKDPTQFKIARPDFIDHRDRRRFRRLVDGVIDASAALTDEQKVIAEVMDNKRWGIGHSAVHLLIRHDQNGEQGIPGWAFFQLVHTLATFETTIAVWHHKIKYDAVRPISAIRYVYGRRRLTAWGGPGKGTVNDIPADQWSPYLPTGDHPEYPSGSTTVCAASAQAARAYFGDDTLDWKFTVKAGATRTEPGIVPRKDIEVHFPTWTDFNKVCGDSRVWAGVHFQETIDRSRPFGDQFGDLANEFVQRHIKGQVKS